MKECGARTRVGTRMWTCNRPLGHRGGHEMKGVGSWIYTVAKKKSRSSLKEEDKQ